MGKEYTTSLQLKVALEDQFKRLLRKNRRDAETALIALQKILREPARGQNIG